MGGGLWATDQIVQSDAEVVGQNQKIFDIWAGRAGFPNLKR